MKKRRFWFLGGAALVLAVLNIWRWISSATVSGPPSHAVGVEFAGETPVLRVETGGVVSPIPLRDLFQAKVAVSNRPRRPTNLPPPKTPEQIAEELARAELAQIKLLGVVFRGDQGEALMLANGTSVTVRTGARLGNHFVIERITPEIVDVRDPDTQVSGQLQLAGH